MKRIFNPCSLSPTLLAKGALAALGVTTLAIAGAAPAVKASLSDSPKAIVDEVWQIVNNEFVGREFDQDAWQVKRQELLAREYRSQDDAYSAIRKALRDLGDPYTRFMSPSEFRELTDQTTGELSGVGVRLTVDQDAGVLTVVEPLEDTPAAAAGLEPGDRILRIDGKPTALMTVEQASELMRGPEGTTVTLQVSRPQRGLFELSLTRAQIEVPVLHAALRQENGLRIGYLKLDEFSSHAAEQMEDAIHKLNGEDVQAYVLDLRGNPGGLLFASVDIARMWMETGPIVSTVNRKGGNRSYDANRTAISRLPLVVLVDGNSASASEILAGALKDSGRATLIGSRTYGKGTVQSVHALSDESGLAVTISRYYPPSGVNINKHGIEPNIAIDLTRDQQRLLSIDPTLRGTGRDPHYLRALGVLQTAIANQPAGSPAPISRTEAQ